jgi:hypothetical protein
LSSQSTKKTVGAARAALFVVLEALCLISDFFSEGCPLSRISLSVSLPLPRGKKKDSRKMTIFYARGLSSARKRLQRIISRDR